MTKPWPTIPLGEALKLDLDRVPVDASTSYPMVGVLSFGRGLFEREPIENGKTSYRVFNRLNAEHVVMSQLFGWEGALALSEKKFAGRFLSPQFPTFTCNTEKLDRTFLGWLMRRPAFWEDLGSRASGMGDRRRTLTPDALFKCEIPLPPLAEQRRVVARIEELAAQIHEALTLRQHAIEQAKVIIYTGCETALTHAEGTYPSQELNELVQKERGISYGVVQTGQDTDGGIPTLRAGDLQWFACNTERVKRVSPEVERSYERTRLRGGELLLRIRGGVGALAICPTQLVGGNVSREIAVIPLVDQVDPRFAMYILAAPTSQERMSGHIKGTSYVGINLKDVRTLRLPVPPLVEQRRIVAELDALHAEVDGLKRLQAETAAELDALLPAILDKAFKGQL